MTAKTDLLKSLAVAGLVCLTAVGCNTIKGAGRDVQRGGEIISDSARNLEGGQVHFMITPSASPGGTITPAEAFTMSSGSSRTYTFHAQPGYRVVDLVVDGKSIGPRSQYTFTNLRSNHTISVSFGLER